MDANREQREAVEHTQGPLLVTAGPGTGKTFVIENKVVHLVTQEGLAPEDVLCLTFTEKAAHELQDRVTEALAQAQAVGEVHAATFHAFCQGLLSEFAGRAGLPPQFHLLNGAPLEYLVLGKLDRFEIEAFPMRDGGVQFVQDLLWLRQRCLQERIPAKEAVAVARRELQAAPDADSQEVWAETLDLARGLDRLDEVLAEAGVVTYEDLISKALALVEEDPLVRRTLGRRYDQLLVDEFQDNNYAQARLVHAFEAAGVTVTVVGDEDQSIYKFRGANEANLKEFLDRFSERAGRVDLVENYRSTPTILAAAEALITHARDRLDKPPLVAAREDLADPPAPVTVLEAEWPDDEARAIAAEIERLHQEEGIPWGEMAVLYRTSNIPSFKVLDQALDERGIPREITSAGDLLARPEVKDLVSWLLVLRAPREPGPALHRVLVSPEVGLPLQDEPVVTKAVKYGAKRGLEALSDPGLLDELSYRGRRAVAWLDETAHALVEARRSAQPAAYVGRVLRTTGLLARHTGEDDGAPSSRGLAGARSLVRLVQVAREWERAHPLSTVDEFVEYLAFLTQRGSDIDEELEPDLEEDSVKVMTVHKSKGKEFQVVFVMGLNKQHVPGRARQPRRAEFLVAAHKGQGAPPRLDIEEERRLFFVAMTRARDHLYLTRHHRTTATKHGVKDPSPFLHEIGLPTEDAPAGLPDYLAYQRLNETGGEHQRPLAMDEGLWLANRVAAQARALARTAGSSDGGGGGLTDPLAELVETALSVVAYEQPDVDLSEVTERLSSVLGPLDVQAPDRRQVDRALARGVLEGFRFSPTAFRAYDDCPKRFYYRYVLGVPQPPRRPLEKGALTHRILERFHTEAEEGSREELIALLDDEFARRVTAEHEKEAADVRAEIQGYLDAFWQDRDQAPGTPRAVEHALQVDLPDFGLTAKLDRVDERPDGSIELIDYKTGRAKSANHYLTKDLQIPLYVQAWTETHGTPPRYATIWSLKDARLVRIDVEKDLPEELLAERYEEARTIRERVREGDFEATPGYHCKWCPFNFICGDAEFT